MVATVRRFRGADSDHSAEEWIRVWVAFGVPPQLIEIILDLRLKWRDDRAIVAWEHRGREGAFEDVSMVLLGLMQFDNFSDSRWLGAGPACRDLLRSLMVGVSSLISFVRKDSRVSEYHISGFSRLTPSLRRFVCVAGVMSHLPESLQVELLDDPQVPIRVDYLEEVMLEEARWLWSLRDTFWERLAPVGACAATTIRHEVVRAAMVCCAFVDRRLFRAARQPPWALCTGSIHDNLRCLKAQDRPQEDATRKIWELLQVGYPLSQVSEAIELMRSCPWSIALKGQQAALTKQHRAYSRRVLAASSMVALLPPLLAATPHERRTQELKRKLQAHARKRPENMTGFNLFVRDAIHTATRRSSTGQLQASLRKQIVANSGAVYAGLSESQRKAYNHTVASEAVWRREELEADAAHLR